MSSGRSNIVDVCVDLHHETERAVLVSDTGNRAAAKWLPKSMIEIDPRENGTIIISGPEWLLKREGLL